MKLNSFRDKDRVHLRDMISLDMIDSTWLKKFPEQLGARLKDLLDDPETVETLVVATARQIVAN